jgi:hypothetical protein
LSRCGGVIPDPRWTDAPHTANPQSLVKEHFVNPRIGWGQPPAGWGSSRLPGWSPLVDPGPRSLQAARSVGRWLWPTLAVGGFLTVVAYVLGHDDPAPGVSRRGLLMVALAAVVVVVLTVHRRYGLGPLVRALAEYALVALLAALLTGAGAGIDQQPAANATPAKSGQVEITPDANPKPKPKAEAPAGDDRPVVIRVGARVVRAVTGAVGWLVDLWRQADQQAQPTKGEAMAAASPLASALPARSTWRSP